LLSGEGSKRGPFCCNLWREKKCVLTDGRWKAKKKKKGTNSLVPFLKGINPFMKVEPL
jgi:hypothetical protein